MDRAPLLPPDWPVLSALLDEALALPLGERLKWVESLGAEHAERKETLRKLLATGTGDFLDTLPKLGEALGTQDALCAGQEIGPYRLLRQIGAGGMGAVWLAERADGSLKRKVALKLPRLAWGDALARRLARERDILASLEHPHIARLYDAGVDRHGRPYLALEYVEGQPIDVYCDSRKLTVRERLSLVLRVASAVAFAHSRLVVHRDLKPSNIMVTADGQVRLLDFGIAKLLAIDDEQEAAADLTAALGQGLTLNYASPEQVQGVALTTATDQYSLAVLTYELLCGLRPHGDSKQTRLALARAIAETDAPRLGRREFTESTAEARSMSRTGLQRLLKGDLETVLAKALARKPAERYASIDAFADDLRRWLDELPIKARPQNATYVALRLVQRHRLTSMAAAIALILVAAASIAAVIFAFQAQEETERARMARDFLVALFTKADPYQNDGWDITAREMLEAGEHQLSIAGKESQLRTELSETLADLWFHFGDFEKASIAQERVSEHYRARGNARALSASLLREGELAAVDGNLRKAELKLGEAIGYLPETAWPRELQARSWILRGNLLLSNGEPRLATDAFDQALAIGNALNDASLQAPALLGGVRSRYVANDVISIEPLLDTASKLISIVPAQEKKTRIFLLHASTEGLFYVGRYREGLEFAEQANISAASMGRDPATHINHRLIWLRYCLILGHAKDAVSWLLEHENRLPPYAKLDVRTGVFWHSVAARIWAQAGDAQKAFIELERAEQAALNARRLSSTDKEILVLAKARVYLTLNQPKSALQVLQRKEEPGAEELEPRGPYVHWMRGVAYAANSKHLIALQDFESAIEGIGLSTEHPDSALLAMNIVITLLRLRSEGREIDAKRFDEAREKLAKARAPIARSFGVGSTEDEVAAKLSDAIQRLQPETGSAAAKEALARVEFDQPRNLFF